MEHVLAVLQGLIKPKGEGEKWGQEGLAGWLNLLRSSLMQIMPGMSGCPAERHESLLLSGPGGGTDASGVPVFWGWCPFPVGDSKGIFSLSQMNEKQQNLGFLSVRSCRCRL